MGSAVCSACASRNAELQSLQSMLEDLEMEKEELSDQVAVLHKVNDDLAASFNEQHTKMKNRLAEEVVVVASLRRKLFMRDAKLKQEAQSRLQAMDKYIENLKAVEAAKDRMEAGYRARIKELEHQM